MWWQHWWKQKQLFATSAVSLVTETFIIICSCEGIEIGGIWGRDNLLRASIERGKVGDVTEAMVVAGAIVCDLCCESCDWGGKAFIIICSSEVIELGGIWCRDDLLRVCESMERGKVVDVTEAMVIAGAIVCDLCWVLWLRRQGILHHLFLWSHRARGDLMQRRFAKGVWLEGL